MPPEVATTGKFRQYSHGPLKNLIVYGSPVPPKYNLQKVTAPVALIYAQKDFLAIPEDVAKLSEELPNVVAHFKIKYEEFTHLDFVMAIHVKSLVYDDILDLMSKH